MKKILSTFNFQLSTRKTAGFTLVELLVSLSLFTVVVLASMGSVLVINNAAHQVDAMRTVLDNLNFAVDSMTRTIHTADAISCLPISSSDPTDTKNCVFGKGTKTALYLLSTIGQPEGEPQNIEYSIHKIGGKGQLYKTTSDDSNGVALTAPEIDIQTLHFYVSGARSVGSQGGDDHTQPQVTMVVQGVANVGRDSAPFTLQTLVSVRKIEQ